MRFGIHVGHLGGPLDELRKLWRFADEHGFDWFSVSDHFQETPARGGGFPCLESIATLTAAAVETTRVRVSCLVFCISYRHPIVLAKALTTIDHLSNGRVTCGLGAGWHEDEYRAYGIPFPNAGTREDQLEEYTQVLRLLFDDDYSDFLGSHYTLAHAPNFPKPVQKRLPILIGGGGEKRTLRTTARYADGWNLHAPAAARAEERFREEWSGRVPADNSRTGFLRGLARDAIGMVAGYRNAGVDQLNIAVRSGPYDWDALAAFAEEVMPSFR